MRRPDLDHAWSCLDLQPAHGPEVAGSIPVTEFDFTAAYPDRPVMVYSDRGEALEAAGLGE
jgi:hypothetical protein